MLCNGVTMYFPSANYLLKCLQLSADATRDGGLVIYGDIQSRRHVLPFRAHVETYQALRRQDATAMAVLNAAKQSVVNEELSYFDDVLFHRLDTDANKKLFQDRLAKVEMRVKRGWWHSEFNRFRYDVWLVLKEEGEGEESRRSPKFQKVDYKSFCQELQLRDGDGINDLVDPQLVEKLPKWTTDRLEAMEADGEDGFVVSLPNARTYAATKLLEWLEEAAKKNMEILSLPGQHHPYVVPRDFNSTSERKYFFGHCHCHHCHHHIISCHIIIHAFVDSAIVISLPGLLHPADAHLGSVEESAKHGVEPEMLFTMELPKGWTQCFRQRFLTK